jgi:SAM-dependent methyltransferase
MPKVTFRSLISRLGKEARRLGAAVGRGFGRSRSDPARPVAAAPRADVGLGKLYPGLPDAALKAAVEDSLTGVTPSEHSLTRFSMYAALSDRLAAHDGLTKKCLSISGSSRIARVMGLKAAKIVEAAYPEHSMLALGFADAAFDFCVSDQVLEHVEGDPFEAVRESFRVVAPGGFVVHASCLLNPVHREPGDFWRFTPDALALLCRTAGGTVIEAASWGNREALALTQVGIRMQKVPADPRHPLHRIAIANDPNWPIHTWVVARKPG